MARRSLQWPKMLGSFLGLEALGIFMCQARLLFWHSYNSGWPSAGTTWFWLILAMLLSVLAYCLYRAQNWARLTAIILGTCLCGYFILETIAAEMSWREMLRYDSKAGWELWRLQIMSAVDSTGSQLALFLAPVALIIGVLCHRDVAATFRPPTNERSNHAME
jgi:hypothetical protein